MKTRIKELRLERRFTQESLASEIGANQTTLSKIECGISVPDATLLVNLSGLFHVSTDYLLHLSDHRLSADVLLSDDIHNFQRYQTQISLLQKLNHHQRKHLQSFLESIHAFY